ncbi:MAG: hypothetical protein Q8L48_20040 [Archangium sp.]|nr:hypothetical protein [Archangium sp.]
MTPFFPRGWGLVAALLLLCSCVETRSVSLTFGDEGEGLDGFLCKDSAQNLLLSRLPADGRASLVIDFVRLGGVPGCRTGQLVKWCATHDCVPIQSTRSCIDVTLPAPGAPRKELRAALLAAFRASGAKEALADAPDEFVLVRVVGTAQGCDSLLPAGNEALPAFDKAQLVGCAYSCPVLFDKVEQDVYLGFETLVDECDQGVRICSDGQLQWQP